VVDDVPQGRAMLLDALGMLGFEMADAGNGEEALAVAARFRPDLVVMDVMMPVMNGLEATRRLRLSPESAKVAVVSVSANASAEAHSREAGANAFVVKPIELPDLLNAIAAVLELTWIREDPVPREQQSS
jgi:CheY-like chemotaxis protein